MPIPNVVRHSPVANLKGRSFFPSAEVSGPGDSSENVSGAVISKDSAAFAETTVTVSDGVLAVFVFVLM
jgi:hypothetical protein